ncbi:hypothetical protein A4G19_10580 [Pasteurellaceae bacterium Macca]|nr:hypothetical protein [Pasteurellaceae bacterium Macca]MCK3656169.1 hypothetical protein [Pasteurellaceae bacterium Macca]
MNLPEILRNNPKIKVRKYKPLKQSIRTERWYLGELRGLLNENQAVIESVLKNKHTFFSPTLFADSQQDDIDRTRQVLLKAIEHLQKRKVEEMAERIAQGFVARGKAQHDTEFSTQIKQAIGIDVKSYLASNSSVEEKLNYARLYNVSLIKNLHTDYLNKINDAVSRNALSGGSLSALTAEIKKIGSISEKRAVLIARDQSAKFHGSMTQARQEQMGITHYTWSTSNDERVRESHQANEGKVFAWNDPPETGHPTHEINCRCVALPFFGKVEDVKAKNQDLEQQRQAKKKEKTEVIQNPMTQAEFITLTNEKAVEYNLEHLKQAPISKAIKLYGLTKAEALSIVAYTGGVYEKINQALLKNKLSPLQRKYVNQLESALRKMPNYEGTSYRRTKLSKKEIARYVKGENVVEPAFISTTQLEEPLNHKGNVKFIITGKSGKQIERISLSKGEKEVLYPTGKKFKIKNVEVKGLLFKTTMIYLTEIFE